MANYFYAGGSSGVYSGTNSSSAGVYAATTTAPSSANISVSTISAAASGGLFWFQGNTAAHNSATWPTTGWACSYVIQAVGADLTWYTRLERTRLSGSTVLRNSSVQVEMHTGQAGTGTKTASGISGTLTGPSSTNTDADLLAMWAWATNANMMTAWNATVTVGANTWHGNPNFTPPAAPTTPTQAPTVAQAAVGINVTTPSSFDGSNTSYNIYRDGTTQVATGQGLSATYNDTGVTEGQSYYYTVRGVTGLGESANGPQSSAVTAPVLAPAVGWDGTAKKFTYSATDPSQTSGTPISISVLVTAKPFDAIYKVYRATTSGGTKTLVKTTGTITGGSGDFLITIDNNAGATSYYFYVTATNTSTSTESAYSTERSLFTGYGWCAEWATGFHAASDHIGGVINGVYYGGQGSAWNGDTTENGAKSLGWVKYDPAAGTRTTFTIADANYKGGGRYSCQTVNDYIWVFGAQPTPGTATNQVWYWTPTGGTQGTWTQHGTSMPATTKYVTTRNGNLVYAAGQNGTLQSWNPVAGGSWTSLAAPYATPQWIVYLPSTGLIYCYFTNDTMRSYNPSNDTWSTTNLTPPPTSYKYNYSSNPVAHPTYDRFYMVGGYDQVGTVYTDNSGWSVSYDASTDTWTEETDHLWPGVGNANTRGTRQFLIYWDTYDTFQCTARSYWDSGSVSNHGSSYSFKAHYPASVPAYSGSISPSGTGTLTLSGTPGPVQAAGLSGAGTLTLAGTPAVTGTAALAGEGGLTGFAPQQEIGDVTFAGEGTLTGAAAALLLPPTGLTVTVVSPTQLDISWDAATGATGYDLERDGQIISEYQPTTSYSDTGLTEGTTYTYRVRSQKVES